MMTTYEEARRRRICSPGRGLQYPISANDLKREIAAALSQFSSPSTFSVEVVAKDNIAVFVDDPQAYAEFVEQNGDFTAFLTDILVDLDAYDHYGLHQDRYGKQPMWVLYPIM